jgi:hypothetical protein
MAIPVPNSIFIIQSQLTLKGNPDGKWECLLLFISIKYIQYKTIKEQLPNQSPRA